MCWGSQPERRRGCHTVNRSGSPSGGNNHRAGPAGVRYPFSNLTKPALPQFDESANKSKRTNQQTAENDSENQTSNPIRALDRPQLNRRSFPQLACAPTQISGSLPFLHKPFNAVCLPAVIRRRLPGKLDLVTDARSATKPETPRSKCLWVHNQSLFLGKHHFMNIIGSKQAKIVADRRQASRNRRLHSARA